jgi:E3 SUMO-protein ligase RanBP2
LYFGLKEYELTRRYVSNYLTVREDSACAHKLLGQALENLGQKEKALAQYKCSLELDSKQQDLALKGKIIGMYFNIEWKGKLLYPSVLHILY